MFFVFDHVPSTTNTHKENLNAEETFIFRPNFTSFCQSKMIHYIYFCYYHFFFLRR